MNDAQIWTIIGAFYAVSGAGYLMVRRLDRIFDRVGTRPRSRPSDPASDATGSDEPARTTPRRDEG